MRRARVHRRGERVVTVERLIAADVHRHSASFGGAVLPSPRQKVDAWLDSPGSSNLRLQGAPGESQDALVVALGQLALVHETV